MRNGINVAAVSELVNEIRKVPRESEIDYAIALSWRGGPGLHARTTPLRFGTKRFGRDFNFCISSAQNPDPEAAPLPADYFMLGLGACVGNILVQGASYKGLTLDQLTVETATRLTSQGLETPDLKVKVTSDAGRWQYKQMMMNVARFSPNFITVSLPNQIETEYTHRENRFANSDRAPDVRPAQGGPIALGVDVRWRNATQFDASLRDRVETGQPDRPRPGGITVDQPVPAAGLNEAPNPQEYLLAGVAGDVAWHLIDIAAEKGAPLLTLDMAMSCHLDMKGCFNIFDKSAIQLQNNRLQISATSESTEAEMQAFIKEAQARSACYQAFINALPPKLERED